MKIREIRKLHNAQISGGTPSAAARENDNAGNQGQLPQGESHE